MKTMVIDTSSSAASIAVLEDGTVLGEFTIHTEKTHSQKLMPMLDQLMKQLELRIKDIDAYAVCEGPGSFTGVRIGLSAVKAFAHPFDKPVKTFSSMKLLAGAFSHFEGMVLSTIDAKRNTVYFGLYRWRLGELETIAEGVEDIDVLLEDVASRYMDQYLICTGDATWIYQDAFSKLGSAPAIRISGKRSSILSAANFRFIESSVGPAVSYMDVKANYMKKSQAERDQSK